MTVAPQIRSAETLGGSAGPSVRLAMTIPVDLAYFDGHFSECPLLAGVVQLNWALEFARHYLNIVEEFQSVSALKFKRVIQPGDEIEMQLDLDAANRHLRFEYRNGEGVCSSGTISFTARVAASPP